jgi:hypothetical protein
MSKPAGSIAHRLRHAVPLLLAVALAGCATRSADVRPRPTDPALYAGWQCDRLHDEIDAVQARAADVAYAVDARVGNNMIALGVGVAVFWPALLAMRPDGEEAQQLAELKGRYEALQAAAAARGCAAAPSQMTAARAAALPLAVGERLVYEQRNGELGPAQRLGMRLVALRRDQLEFTLDLDGLPLQGAWRQDLSGNSELDPRPPQLGWYRLLRPDLQLGQVLAGELAAAGQSQGGARVRGQVVAVGPQVLDGRAFEVAVIELFGDAPLSGSGIYGTGNTRIEGVMAVDRRNGLLLRLELRCANPEFALQRRLLRVERAERRPD